MAKRKKSVKNSSSSTSKNEISKVEISLNDVNLNEIYEYCAGGGEINDQYLENVRQIRRLLSISTNPPVSEIIELNFIPLFLRFKKIKWEIVDETWNYGNMWW